MNEFIINQKIIWDSGFGYDLGFFIGKGNSWNTWLIDKVTGKIKGNVSISKGEIFPYSKELHDILYVKYKYDKCF